MVKSRTDALPLVAAAGFACVAAGATVSARRDVRPDPPAPSGRTADVGGLDVGTLGWDEVVRASVRLTNDTADPLRIVRVDTDCGCTNASVAEPRVRPGGGIVLSADFHAGRSDDRDTVENSRVAENYPREQFCTRCIRFRPPAP